jgi:cytoskeletal protein CcmA (bactofilin family)
VFWKSDNTNGSGGSAVTIIGPGVSIKGNIAFSGYLRVQGEIIGNVACNNDAQGTIVIHGPGSVTGAIHAPNIVVGGRVHGPIHAMESLEIHEGASVAGDVRYKRLSIQAGGTFDGALFPMAAPVTEPASQERRIAVPEAPLIKALDGPHAHERRAADHFWSTRKIAVAAALLIAVIVFFWPSHMPTDASPPQIAAVPTLEVPAKAAPDASRAPVKVEPPIAPKLVEPASVALEPRTEPRLPAPVVSAPAAEATPPTATETPKADPGKVLTIEGMESDKPAGFFFVNTREPVVLYQKQRSSDGDGTRIAIGRGAKKRFPISEQEVVRVAEGEKLDMFYQGRKVPPRVVQSGTWIGFVPTDPMSAPQ